MNERDDLDLDTRRRTLGERRPKSLDEFAQLMTRAAFADARERVKRSR